MKQIPEWARAKEFCYLDFSFRNVPSIQSARVIIAREHSSQKLVVLKYIGKLLTSKVEMYQELTNISLLKAAEIKSKHPAFDDLISVKWTELGLVLVKKYLPNTRTIGAIGSIELNQIIILLIQVCDALRHIHQYESSHNDITTENIIVNNKMEVFLVDYDFAFPIRDFFRSSYARHSLLLLTLEERQVADIHALEAVILSIIRKSLSLHAPKSKGNDYDRLRQTERTLTKTTMIEDPKERLNILFEVLQGI